VTLPGTPEYFPPKLHGQPRRNQRAAILSALDYHPRPVASLLRCDCVSEKFSGAGCVPRGKLADDRPRAPELSHRASCSLWDSRCPPQCPARPTRAPIHRHRALVSDRIDAPRHAALPATKPPRRQFAPQPLRHLRSVKRLAAASRQFRCSGRFSARPGRRETYSITGGS